MSAADPSEKIWKLMDDVGMAMLVTHADGQNMRARPMAARVEEAENAIYFFTDAQEPKEREIVHDSNVCLTFSDVKANRYVSVAGVAEVFSDAGLADRLWRGFDKAYFSDPTDPRLRVIRVTPEGGEFWEGSGKISMLASMLKASTTGETPKLGESAKVAM